MALFGAGLRVEMEEVRKEIGVKEDLKRGNGVLQRVTREELQDLKEFFW